MLQHFIEAYISGVVFAHNNLDINACLYSLSSGTNRYAFLTEEFSLLRCSLTRSWMKRVVLPMYC